MMIFDKETRMKEQAIDGGRGVEVAEAYRTAMEAMHAETQCARCQARKTSSEGWSTSITRTKTRAGQQKRVELLCGPCSRFDDIRRRGFKSPADRLARLEDAERVMASRRGGTTSPAARLARLEQAERNVAAWRRPAR